MTGLNHVTTAAVVALAVKEPALVLPLAVLSHFVLDALPHYGIVYAERSKYPSFKRIMALDSTLTPLMIVSVFLITDSWLVAAAMLLAISPDFVWFIKYGYDRMLEREFTLPQDHFSRFHKKIQWGERPWGWTLELVWLVVMLGLLANQLV